MPNDEPNFESGPRLIIWLIGSALLMTLLLFYLCGCSTAPLPIAPPPVPVTTTKAAKDTPAVPMLEITWSNQYVFPGEYTFLKWSTNLALPYSQWVICYMAPAVSNGLAYLPETNAYEFIVAWNQWETNS